jgi:hypothetical protein
LRKIYVDPITGSTEWGLMKGPDGGIMGVYSQSKDTPLKILGAGGATYADWKFIYQPATATPIKPAAPAKPATPAAPTAR